MKSALMLATLAVALAGCGKAPEPATPAAPTPAAPIPSAAPAPTVQAASGGEPTPAAMARCKLSATPVQTPTLTVTEADLGVPPYPGAKVDKGLLTTGPDGSGAFLQQETSDPPEKVLDFYRGRLKALAAGRELNDSGGPNRDGNSMLELDIEVGKPGIQIITTGNSQGTALSIGTNCSVK